METIDKNDENIDMKQVIDYPIDSIEPNKIIKGEIVTIDGNFAYVNVGIKIDGRVNLSEFDVKPAIGDPVDVILVNTRLMDGMYVFSKKLAEREKRWSEFIEQHTEDMETITGTLESSGQKGLIVDCGGVEGFLPFSQCGDIKGKKEHGRGQSYIFKIKTIDHKKRLIILSRKEYLDDEKDKLWDNFLSKYREGSKVKGKVLKIVDFGAFIEVEGIDCLLHRNDMSWRKVFKHQKILKVGEEREFVVLAVSREDGKISLGLKQLAEDPWLNADTRYKVGDAVKGHVVTLTNSGVFVELEEGVDGYIDSSDISWTQKNINPGDVFKKGQNIEVKILGVNKEEKRIPLGYKQLLPNPWSTIDEKFPVGTVIKSKIKKVVTFGMFVEIENGIDGLVHISDVTWDDNDKTPLKQFRSGESVEFKILDIKKDEMKISCGLKQLIKSPWQILKEKYPVGHTVAGVVSGLVPFGLFIKIEDDIEGLVHISEVSKTRIEKLEDQFRVGDKVNAVVLGIDVDKKRLSLSIKNFDDIAEKEHLDKILNEAGSKKVTLGDFIKINL
ncbi:MAG: S1 RNA-binding domain-containing protein [Spirochaetes bacterium]|nr:S1 RNA-binding domain-containing protein [Spirochaetota bacterium]